jgi:DNA (cytosine-5)-methyltransferase 1
MGKLGNSSLPVVLDLFCGAGGMSLGFKMAGYVIGLGIDRDSQACQTHAHNFNGHTICNDLHRISDPLALLSEQGIDRVDVVIGGPPCQGFSRVGRGKLRTLNQNHTQDLRNQLYLEYIRFVAIIRPLYFVMENVPDLGKYPDGDKRLLDKIQDEFERLGYITNTRILNAAAYGVPQFRKRLFVIGNRLGQSITWPEPTHGPGYSDSYVTVWQAISDLPIVDINHHQDEIAYMPRDTLNDYQFAMRQDSNGVLYNHQTRWHNAQDLEAFSWMPEGGKYKDLPAQFKRYRDDIFQDKYRKLVRNQPSWTVEAHIGKDSYRHIYPSIPEGPEPPRTISVREAARLQSFPDHFRLLGPFTKQFYQLGNAVPPLLAKAIAEHLKPFVIQDLEVDANGRGNS